MNKNINDKLMKMTIIELESVDETTLMPGMFEKMAKTTTENVRHEIKDDSLLYILVPLAVLFGVFLLAALVLFMARNRRRLVRMCKTRQELATHFSYLDDESDISMLDNCEIDVDPTECLLQGKLHINNDPPITNIANRVRFV